MFADRDRHARTSARETALACLEAGIEAALPRRVVETAVSLEGDSLRIRDREYDLARFDRVLVLGAGKAAGGVAAALADVLGDRLDGGVVVTTDPDDATPADAGPVDVVAGDHPRPTERNVAASRRLLDLAEEADGGCLVLAVVTGGASSLLCVPAEDLSLGDLRATTDALLTAGATIDEANAVRKRLSAVKGGRLAQAAAPAAVVTLAISDVVGDDPATIGSGPTVPDPTTFDDATDALRRHDLADEVPDAVRERIERGATGEGPSGTVTPGADADWHPLATGRTAVEAAREVAEERGYDALVLSTRVRGEAREVGRVHAAVAEECRESGEPADPPAVVLSGGEVTVTVRGDGVGGPNAELALAAGLEFAREGTDAVLASVDTDGIDGATDAAGAIVDRETVDDPAAARRALADSDAGSYLDARGALLESGPTGTNVNDLRVLVLP